MVNHCESCGREINGNTLGKYATGRFCSRACANRRNHSTETKAKISQSVIKHNQEHPLSLQKRLEASYKTRLIKQQKKSPMVQRVCAFCMKEFTVHHHSSRKYCGEDCKLASLRIQASRQTNHGAACKGKYKGISCDSKLELAFLIYCLDHKIKIERCKEHFEYFWEGKTHLYTPDFIIGNSSYIEIKGWECKINKVKLDSVRKCGKLIYILYAPDLQKCINYVKSQYNISGYNLDVLYDTHK